MSHNIYNIPLLGDTKAFWAFLDAYAQAVDVDPNCGQPALHKSPSH